MPSVSADITLPPSVSLVWRSTRSSQAASAERWKRDLALLTQENIRNPEDPRTVFYLANTFYSLDMYEQAFQYYMERAEMKNTWDQEVFVSLVRAADCLDSMNRNWTEVCCVCVLLLCCVLLCVVSSCVWCCVCVCVCVCLRVVLCVCVCVCVCACEFEVCCVLLCVVLLLCVVVCCVLCVVVCCVVCCVVLCVCFCACELLKSFNTQR